MIVQPRSDRLRLVRQHDHALAAGELAHAWRPDSGPLPFRLVAAVGLHDVAWRELDDRPRLDPETGRPHAFDTYPLGPKLRAYAAGIDEMEAVDPWIGLLGSLHYASFLDGGAARRFLASERERRERLRAKLRGRRAGGAGAGEGEAAPRGGGGAEEGGAPAGTGGGGRGAGVEGRLRRHLRWLKFFDGLSLRLCLAPPAVADDALPAWIDRDAPATPPAGQELTPRWSGEGRVDLGPAALAGPVTLEVPFRDLPRLGYDDADALEAAWRGARERTWRLRVLAGA